MELCRSRTGIQDNLFTSDVIADPYAYYGRLRGGRPNSLERGL